MEGYSRSHLSDQALLCHLASNLARDRAAEADVLADLAEIDARQLYLPAAYPSMFAYCVGELHLSEDAAYHRIRAARTARQFPALFHAVAEGRLHQTALCLLAPHLTPENADDLLAAATHRSKAEIERLLAERFPRPAVAARVEELVLERVGQDLQLVPERVGEERPAAQGPREAPAPRAKMAPLAPERYVLQVTIERSTHEKLRYAQALLGHRIPSGDIAQVLDRVLDAAIPQLEKRKFSATARPRPGQPRASGNPRHIPAAVKRAVWERDGGQCTFRSDNGRRCAARARLEFDHIQEVARGGRATVEWMRLRCRAHNHYGAERTFGTAFMRRKREQARQAGVRGAGQAAAAEPAEDRDVLPWLRALGFRADEARRGAAACEDMPVASLEERLRRALSVLRPPHQKVVPSGMASGSASRGRGQGPGRASCTGGPHGRKTATPRVRPTWTGRRRSPILAALNGRRPRSVAALNHRGPHG